MNGIVYKLEQVTDSSSRFVAYDGDTEAGETTFVKTGEKMLIIDHTDINDDYRGQGLGAHLVKHVVDLAIKENKKIIPLCPFAKAEFKKHPEYKEIEK